MPAKISQYIMEVPSTDDNNSRVLVDQYVLEVVEAFTVGIAPAGLFGGLVSQDVVEVLMSVTLDSAKVSQDVVEVLMSVDDPTSGSSGTTSFGYSV